MQLTEAMKEMRANGKSYQEIAAAVGCAKSTVQEAFGVRKGRGSVKGEPPVASAVKAGRSLSDFRKQYDKDLIIPMKIREALKSLGNSWVYEKEFVHKAGVSFADLGNYRDSFSEYVVSIRQDNKRVWAGTVKLATQLKEIA